MNLSLCRRRRLVVAICHRKDERKLFDDAADLGFLLRGDPRQNEGQIISARLLVTLDDQLLHPRRVPPPRVASIRAFYRRRRTLFEHQESARQALGRGPLNDHAERGLTAYLRREAAAASDVSELVTPARTWLVGRHYVLPRDRDILAPSRCS